MAKPKMSPEDARKKAEYRENFGKRVRLRRDQLNMTQEELAKRLGFKSKTSINKIELGKQDITQSKISALAAALDMPIETLMGWDQKPDTLIAVGTYEVDLLTTYRDLSEVGRMKVYLYALQVLQSETTPASQTEDASSSTSKVG